MEVTQPRTRIFELKFLLFIALIFISITCTAIRYFWLESFEFRLRENTFRLAQELGFNAAGTGEVNDELWKKFITRNDQIVYLVFSYKPLGYRKAFFHPQKTHQVSASLEHDVKTASREILLSNLLDNQKTYVNPHVHVVHANLIPPDYQTDDDILGQIKVAYAVPGYLMGISFGRAYRYVLFFIYGLTTLSFLSIIFGPFIGKKKKIIDPKLYSELEKEEFEVQWIEDDDTGKTEPVFIDDKGKSWSLLLPDGDMSDWSKEGIVYVSGEDVLAKPWGSSAVRKDLSLGASYEYQLRALKMAGQDAFIVLFPVGEHQLSWVIGGWHNSKTEVAGYPITSNTFAVEKDRWYYIEIQCLEDVVVGIINGEENWRLRKEDIKKSSPSVGFQKGLGLAVWGGLCRFSEIRFREGEKNKDRTHG
ncbi:MAG TPA: hypothetical protein PKC21_03570 [Oligoflexia bacterium]|mgnify:CR=1 FL=1|nr:hypothetical protein [Oligoflexia bacterium]HMR24415.1 hypothetical protein [Oligoflexia bacterium]